MGNVAWIVVPSGDAISTISVPISSLVENEKFLKKRPCWIHFRRIDEATEEILKEKFLINELSLEDCKSEARSKAEPFENYIFLLLIYYDGGISRQKKLCVFWGSDFIITVGSRRLFEEAKKELMLEEIPFGEGVEKIVWLISSLIADKFRYVTDSLEEQSDDIEAKVFKEQSPELLEDISDLSYEILTLRRALKQIRDTYKVAISLSGKFANPENIHYFRDLLDEISILYDRAETLHEFIQNVLNVFSSLVNFKLNDIMKTLTIFVAILEPLMFISSFYGMNVKNLPLADSSFGIVVISFFMLLLSIGLLYYFRRKRWI
ncbi:magnesium transporter [Balnearium lithotrophicum]|uniref:Magnesium transporter n=1 Tax=Balnearium lithotrophicum TaxID=223788 RepID=A0A521ATU0_9BACT|nr:magnesium transporter CorA family protein [Balnearium lithotrophicum]SMO38217.1 magnesium transporter [Balnearium lithotrophicum]